MSTFLNKLRHWLFSPESRLELTLRTLYHRLAATRLGFSIQHWLSVQSCQRWQRAQRKAGVPELDPHNPQPKVSFICSLLPGQPHAAVETLRSLQKLIGDNWEAIVLPPAGGASDSLLMQMVDADPHMRWHQKGSNNILDDVSSDYLFCCSAGDRFDPALLTAFYDSLAGNDAPDLVFYDCAYHRKDNQKPQAFLKPNQLSPAMMLSLNILSRSFIRMETLRQKSLTLNPDSDLLTQEYGICLRLCEDKVSPRHIPALLVTHPALVKPESPETCAVVCQHLTRLGLDQVAFIEKAHGIRFTWRAPSARLGIIIPSKNHQALLETLLNSIFRHPLPEQFTISIVDNGSDDEATLAYYRTLKKEPQITIIPYPKPFNYSEAINLGAAHSNADLLLLLNDDMAVQEPDWLAEMSQWALREEIGVVGAKLLRANHTIQHAGIVIGLSGFAGHIYLNAPEHYSGLHGSVDWYREYLAVTGACQMVRREVFEAVGGYDQAYQLAFGDIDFCMRVVAAGYRNIYTPFASLFHYEGQSRGYLTPKSDILKGYAALEDYLMEGDPNFSPNLSMSRVPRCIPPEKRAANLADIVRTRKIFFSEKE